MPSSLTEHQKAFLLDSDPSIRWQVLRDLLSTPAAEVNAERALVTTQGWGAELLSHRQADGQWAGGACFPADFRGGAPGSGQPWTSTYPSLCLLRALGADKNDDAVRETVKLVGRSCKWEQAGQPFWEGETEPCINGQLVGLGAYFGVGVGGVVSRLLAEQLEDGGWNCEAENGSVRSSVHTTICVLQGLLEYERASPGFVHLADIQRVRAARKRGEEYLLERSLFRRKSNNEVIDPALLKLAFPTWWHYDILRALDYFRAVGGPPDMRVKEAVEILRSKAQDGLWNLEHVYPGAVHFQMEEPGQPSRWITLMALRVLKWFDNSSVVKRGQADKISTPSNPK
ncbi:hypothetical protein BX600DRAFT_514886 [Xylariales sp. PMI_506]|nr:hypothetical protein BX600DRAFT_514886 [Xylariales sp. PMI_506]